MVWTETERAELYQMIFKLLKEKIPFHMFCNKSKPYGSHKASDLGFQSMLLRNLKQANKLYVRLTAMSSNNTQSLSN